MRLTHHNDPGHGWLEVPLSLLLSLGIARDISGYSYTDGVNAYLEEDMDAGTLCRALTAQGETYTFLDAYTEDSFVRQLAPYNWLQLLTTPEADHD